MSTSWLVYIATYALTGNPILAVVVVLLFVYGGNGWYRGRFWAPWKGVQQWLQIRQLRAHVEVAPHDMQARADLGRLLVERGGFAEAIPHLEAVGAKAPTLAMPAYHLGRAYLGTGDWDRGLAHVERALAQRADLQYGEPLLRLGDFHLDRGAWAQAVPYYDRMFEVHSSSAEAWFKLGRCRFALGDGPGAREAFRQAVLTSDQAPAFKRKVDRPWKWRAKWWLRKQPDDRRRAA
jgi:tetratricopeptide (TPR) repeat protein